MKQPIPFGKYFLLERINVGGMAEVFKAKATGVEGFERLVAVKRILPGIAEDEEFVTMFVDEAKIAVQLTHANIAQIFDLGRVDGSFFIALEYVQGKDLRAISNRVHQRAEALPIPLTCYVIMKLCEGLDYAHNKHDSAGRFLNLVHRDVSPQNILVSYEGEVKIIDFGIAKAAGKAGRTQAGILKGKFGYMSPEQVQGIEIDRRSDVFGVGICLYELLTGERPFAAETDFATLQKVRAAEVTPPSSYNPRLPEELDQIVMRALAKDRDARYPSALALHDALQTFMHTSGNSYSRKDLGLYMHRVFADEIQQENTRDAEYARLDTPPAPEQNGAPEGEAVGLNGGATGHNGHNSHNAHADYALSVQEASADHAHASFSPDSADDLEDAADASEMSDAEEPGELSAMDSGDGMLASEAHTSAEVRRRTSTLLGVPYATGLRLPSVPRPVPSPSSVPPLAASGPASRPPEPSRPSLQAVAPELAHVMDWDDEELSTQIYDKPGQDQDQDHDLDRDQSDDDLEALEASVPDSVEPGSALVPAHFTGIVPVHPPRTSEPPPRAMRLAPPPAGVTLRPASSSTETATGRFRTPVVGQPSRGRPMLAAVVTVVAIIAMIVLGLLLYQQREPGTVSLTTRPSRVEVSVDGRPLGASTSPFVIGELTADRPHEIVVSSQGHAPWTKVVTVAPGQVLSLSEIRLEPIETGFVLTTDPPGASVAVDEKPIPGRTPLRVTDIVPGEHRLRVELNGFASWESSFGATKGTVLPLPTIALDPLPSPEPTETVKPMRGSRRSSASAASSHTGATSGDQHASSKPAATATAEESIPPEPEPEPGSDLTAALQNEPQLALDDVLPQAEEPVEAEPSEPQGAQAATGKLRVNTRPWSQVFIDGQSYGATPRLNIELTAGTHALRLVNDEFKIEKRLDLVIQAGETQSVVINLLDN